MNSIIHLRHLRHLRHMPSKASAPVSSDNNNAVVPLQRVIFLRHVQWIEMNDKELRIKTIHQDEIFSYTDPIDPTATKRLFYDIVKQIRASDDAKVYEL
jgi:hypothetical protein